MTSLPMGRSPGQSGHMFLPLPIAFTPDTVRPAVPDGWRTWDPTLTCMPWAVMTGISPKLGLENRNGHCFRNAALLPLIHSSVFYNWLISHDCEPKTGVAANFSLRWAVLNANDECLLRMFRRVLQKYFPPVGDRRSLYQALQDFWDMSIREFWGQGSKLATRSGIKLGHIVGDRGGHAQVFLPWLIQILAEPIPHIPPRDMTSELAMFRSMFWTRISTYTHCSGPEHHRIPIAHLEQSTIQVPALTGLVQPLTDSIASFFANTPTTYTSFLTCLHCPPGFSLLQTTQHRRIESAPEILLLRVPPRVRDPHLFFIERPYPEALDLSAYTNDNSALKYTLHAVCFSLGSNLQPGPGRAGHAVCGVRAADGHVYYISNERAWRSINGWAQFQAMQGTAYPKGQRLLPDMWMYVRVPDASATVVAGPSGYNDGDRATAPVEEGSPPNVVRPTTVPAKTTGAPEDDSGWTVVGKGGKAVKGRMRRSVKERVWKVAKSSAKKR